MEPEIQIWDLDIVNTIEPAYTLAGQKKKKKKKARKILFMNNHYFDTRNEFDLTIDPVLHSVNFNCVKREIQSSTTDATE